MAKTGNQTPTFERVGEYDHSDAAACVSLFESFGFVFMAWQVLQLTYLLARTAINKVAAKSLCFSVPRQNGKSFACRIYAIWEAMVCGKKVVYSAHNGDVCREFYEMMLNLFENPDKYPDFANEITNIVKQSGRERFDFRSGGSISFQTRTSSKQRGISQVDLLIIDEAQELTPSMYAAIKFTLSAGRSGDSQTVYIGTPPDPSAHGEDWVRFHNDAHDTDKLTKMWWIEWALTDEDVIDRNTSAERKFELAWKYNPGMGGVLNVDDIAAEAEEAAWDIYARERLGWWGRAATAEMVFAADEWNKLTVPNAPDTKQPNVIISYGIKLAPDDSEIALCVAIRTLDENNRKHIYVELRECRSLETGTDWLVDWLATRKDKTASILIDGRNGAADLMAALRDAGFSKLAVSVASTQDAIDAAALLKNLARTERLTHPVSELLDNSAITSQKRTIGNAGGYGYADGQGDSVPLAAASLACRAAYTTKRNPNRKTKLLH